MTCTYKTTKTGHTVAEVNKSIPESSKGLNLNLRVFIQNDWGENFYNVMLQEKLYSTGLGNEIGNSCTTAFSPFF